MATHPVPRDPADDDACAMDLQSAQTYLMRRRASFRTQNTRLSFSRARTRV